MKTFKEIEKRLDGVKVIHWFAGSSQGFYLEGSENYNEVILSGAEIEPYVEPVNNYSTATKLSVVRYLKSTGEWAGLKAVIESDADVYEEWLLSSELLINDPTVQAMKAVQGWTDAELQALFNAVNA